MQTPFSMANGAPEFRPVLSRPKGPIPGMVPGPEAMKGFPPQPPVGMTQNNGMDPVKPFPPQSQGVAPTENQIVDHFASMNLSNAVMGSGGAADRIASTRNYAKMLLDAWTTIVHELGRNPGATEFVPKGTPGGASQSSGSPSYVSYASMLAHRHPSSNASYSQISQGTSFSSAAGSINSPGMSPQGSPMVDRRDKSPIPSIQSPLLGENATSTPANNSTMHESVGGTTYFYTQDDVNSQHQGVVLPNFTVYPGLLPHIAHMRLKANMPSFFMPDEIKMEILNRHAMSLAQIDADQNPGIPQEVDKYHNLFPLEPPPANPLHKSSTFGYPTTCYKGTNTKDSLNYCLRRIHGFHMVNTKCMAIIDLWKKIEHSNLVQLREVFTTKAFGDHSMVFVYDYHAGAETLMQHHFANPHPSHLNGYNSPYNLDGAARPYSAGKGASGPRQHAGLLPESQIWSYIVQITSALRTIHAHGLACRVLDPTKIIITGKSRIRLNTVGIFDVLTFDANQNNPLAVMPHCQQEDLVSLGKVVVALACNSLIGIQREHLQTSLDLISRNYSADLKNLILYLLTNQTRVRSVNDIMPMIGARFYTQLDAAQLRNDVLENELGKEVENGRLFRLMAKLGTINERPEFNMDPSWSETGDRYMLKLFRDFLFHQVDENGAPWIDMAHIVQCLNKLDAGAPEKVFLMSRDEQSVIVVTYSELKQCFNNAFCELLNAGQADTSLAMSHNTSMQGSMNSGMASMNSMGSMNSGMASTNSGMASMNTGMAAPMSRIS